MFGVGVVLMIVGGLSFVLPLFGRQFMLVSAISSESGGSGTAGLILLGVGFVLCFLGSNTAKKIETKEQKELNDTMKTVGFCYCPNQNCRAPNPVGSIFCQFCNTKLRVKK